VRDGICKGGLWEDTKGFRKSMYMGVWAGVRMEIYHGVVKAAFFLVYYERVSL